jgi:hypothetical protein
MQAFEKKSFVGLTPEGRLSVHIDWDGKNLSITGSEGRDHGGQIIMDPWDLQEYAEGYSPELVAQLRDIWERWHLNDLQAGSPAQTAYLDAHPVTDRLNHYTKACEALKAAGLNPDPNYIHNGKPYAYGSAWLRVEVPEDALQFLHALP